jgi:hypothetical protein
LFGLALFRARALDFFWNVSRLSLPCVPRRLEQNAQHIVLVVRDQDPAHQLTDEPRFRDGVNTGTRKALIIWRA